MLFFFLSKGEKCTEICGICKMHKSLTQIHSTKSHTHSDFLDKARDRQRVVGVIGTKERQVW